MAYRKASLAVLGAVVMGGVMVGCASGAGVVGESDLVGTWALEEQFESPEQPFIYFADDATWVSSDGCNQVRGTWELGEDGSLSTTSGPSTLIACEGAQLPLAMSTATSVAVEGDVLTLTSSGESATTELVRSTDPAIGPQGLPAGRWVESDAANAPFLDFSADGSLSGNDGCNAMAGGTWEVADDGKIALSMGATTLKACDGVDTWLSLGASGRIIAQVLTIEDASGSVLGQLTAE